MTRGEDGWITFRVGPEGTGNFLQALYMAAGLNEMDGSTTTDPVARMLEAHERIVVDWLLEHRPDFWARQHERAKASRFGVQAALALERDLFRCIKCQHSRIGSGGLLVERVATDEMLDPDKLDLIHEAGGWDAVWNLFAVCSKCSTELAVKGPAYRALASTRLWKLTQAPAEWVERAKACLLYPAG